ncbi:MAG: hypothetical protein LIO60_00240 [Oscillospiraceae bacterium]|nr:hypothetical protein [Oscillospiraceae bacterium]
MPTPKRDIKDSLFTFLFKQPEYTRALYLQLHPEDTKVTDEDFKLVTLENVLVIGQHNDIGIQVRDRLIFLVEAQSTFSENIPLRMLMYLASTYKEYVEDHKLSLYREKRVSIPRPELYVVYTYVVYTGEKKNVPDTLCLSDLYDGAGDVEVNVKVLRDDGSGDILDQYIEFSQIFDRQVKEYGRTQKAMDETLRICLERGILKPFLESRRKEVVDIMTTLFDQRQVWDIELYNVAKEKFQEGYQEGYQEKFQEGFQEGKQEARAELVKNMLKKVSVADISALTGIPLDEVERLANS